MSIEGHAAPGLAHDAAPAADPTDRGGRVTSIRLVLLTDSADVPAWIPAGTDARRQLVAVVDMVSGRSAASATSATAFKPDQGRVTTGGWQLLEDALATQPLPSFTDIGSRRELRQVRRTVVRRIRGPRHTLLDRLTGRSDHGELDEDDAGGDFPKLRAAAAKLVTDTIGLCLENLQTVRTAGVPQEGAGASLSLEPIADDIERYLCVPPPPRPTLDGIPANEYPDVEYIRRLPKDGTKGHLLE